jgi:hypothetical protein
MSVPAMTTLLVLVATPLCSDGAQVPQRSVSTSRQFIVFGADATLRGAVCEVAERTKKEALTSLQQADDWRTPIVVNVQPALPDRPDVSPAQLNVSQTGFGLKFQLNLNVGGGVNAAAMEREILRAVLLEKMYRGESDTPAGTPCVSAPEWLIEGTLALINARDRSVIADRLSVAVASGKVVMLPEFLQQNPALLESPSRNLYQAYAAALVAMLMQAPDSRERFGQFIAALPQPSNDPFADLQRHFPVVGENAEAADRIWQLSVKRLAAGERYRLMTSEETEQQLAAALRVELPRPGQFTATFTLEEFPQFVRAPEAATAFNQVGERLLLLAGRAHTLYQPVIREYQQMVLLLQKRKTRHIAGRLAQARGTRELLIRRISAIGDYMNWYEATQLHTPSGAFREYLKAADFATARPLQRRRDPISVYLDAMESQF